MAAVMSLLSSRRLYSSFVVSTPIFYVNAAPHIGHAHTLLVADAIKRWHQIRGIRRQSILISGTDEHGQKVICLLNIS